MSLIIWFDLFFLAILGFLCGLNFQDNLGPSQKYHSEWAYNFMTDGVTIVL